MSSSLNIYARNIPDSVKKDFKIWCIQNNVPMQKVIVAMIQLITGDCGYGDSFHNDLLHAVLVKVKENEDE